VLIQERIVVDSRSIDYLKSTYFVWLVKLKMNGNVPGVFPGVNLRKMMKNPDLLNNRLQKVHNANSGVGGVAGHNADKEVTAKKDDPSDVWGYLEAHAAFLGPSLWDNEEEFKVENMDLDEFLLENGIPIGELATTSGSPAHVTSPSTLPTSSQPSPSSSSSSSTDGSNKSNNFDQNDESVDFTALLETADNPTTSRAPKEHEEENEDQYSSDSSANSSNDLESMRTSKLNVRAAKRTPVTRKRKCAASSRQPNVSDDEDTLIPGHDFDPRSRQFSEEELRPQPMTKKSRKQYVPDGLKDEKYWARRQKNNVAAKRSRDARRVKENQIAMRANFLENEVNAVLKAELEKMTKLYHATLKRLQFYEKSAGK